MSGKWHVSLGPHWQRFTTAQPGLQMLGSVQRGAQIGALARCADGSYVQLNGDHQTVLGAFQIERALRNAQAAVPRHRSPVPGSAKPAVAVIIKKRRIVAPS